MKTKFEAKIVVFVATIAFSLFEGFEGGAGDAHKGTVSVDTFDEKLDSVNVITSDVAGLKLKGKFNFFNLSFLRF